MSFSAPRITVITAVYNGADTIESSIKSVLAQERDDIEYIVIDGGSSDGTIQIIDRYRAHIAHFSSEPDDGIYDAWNKGLRVARGQWISFLGADDMYVPGALTAYVRAIEAAGGDDRIEYVSSRIAFAKNGRVVRVYGEPWQWPRFGRFMNVGHVGSMHHRRLFLRLGEYDKTYRVCGDYELLLRARSTLQAYYFPMITVSMSAGGVSNQQLRCAFAEMARAKSEAGGRASWVSVLESAWGFTKAKVRARVWY